MCRLVFLFYETYSNTCCNLALPNNSVAAVAAAAGGVAALYFVWFSSFSLSTFFPFLFSFPWWRSWRLHVKIWDERSDLNDLRREIWSELRKFRKSFEQELGKELREKNSSLAFLNKLLEDVRAKLKEVRQEQKQLTSENAELQTPC